VVDLIRIRESKISKYDITLKKLISLTNARLREMLGLPDNGYLLREEFPDWDQLRSDTIYYARPDIHHVEFQTQNDSGMPLRMFEYFYRILRHWENVAGVPLGNIEQQVLFIGHGAVTMPSTFKHGRTTHHYDVKDLKKFSERWFDELNGSLDAEDWILAYLTAPTMPDDSWRALTDRIVVHIQNESPPATDLPALLIIAAVLRNIEPELQEEIEKMVRVNIGNSRLLRQIYDEGNAEFAVKQILPIVQMALEQKDFFMSDAQADYVAGFNLQEAKQLSFLAIAGTIEDIESYITPPDHDEEYFPTNQLE
jgi:hypothetical protein